jgi:hypothetical protein
MNEKDIDKAHSNDAAKAYAEYLGRTFGYEEVQNDAVYVQMYNDPELVFATDVETVVTVKMMHGDKWIRSQSELLSLYSCGDSFPEAVKEAEGVVLDIRHMHGSVCVTGGDGVANMLNYPFSLECWRRVIHS